MKKIPNGEKPTRGRGRKKGNRRDPREKNPEEKKERRGKTWQKKQTVKIEKGKKGLESWG